MIPEGANIKAAVKFAHEDPLTRMTMRMKRQLVDLRSDYEDSTDADDERSLSEKFHSLQGDCKESPIFDRDLGSRDEEIVVD